MSNKIISKYYYILIYSKPHILTQELMTWFYSAYYFRWRGSAVTMVNGCQLLRLSGQKAVLVMLAMTCPRICLLSISRLTD